MTTASIINLAIVVIYLVGMLGVGLYLARYIRGGDDYFIAGRSLNRWVICGSVMATNVAAVYLVGPAGKAFESGTPLLLMAWSGNMLAAIAAVTFLPRFRRLGVSTITELLERRYGPPVSISVSVIWIIFYALFSGVTMMTCATIITGAFGVPGSFRLPGLDAFETITTVIAGVVILYCLASGLLAVVYTDLLQSFLIIAGAVILLPLGIQAGGGLEVLFDPEKIDPSKWVMWRPSGPEAGIDYLTILMLFVLGLPYWFTSQYMLQRSFAGKTVHEASKGLLWAAVLTGPLTLCYIVPAMAAGANPDFQELTGGSDTILPVLAQTVMPVGLGGLFLAALVAASNSTASSYLNSLATLFDRDLYRPLRPGRDDRHHLMVGRVVTVIAGLVGLVYAIYSHRAGSGLLESAWKIGSIFQPALFVVVAGALYFRRATRIGGLACLVVGIGYTAAGAAGGWQWLGQAWGMDGFPVLSVFFGWDHRLPATRALVGMPLAALVLVGVSLLSRRPESDSTRGLFAEMQFRRAGWTRSSRIGAAVSIVSLVAMVGFGFVDSRLPDAARPWNVVAYLAVLTVFIAGMIKVADALLPVPEEDSGEKAPIEESWLARTMATGRAWAIVYVTAAVLLVVIYLLA
ncbi:MAG: hypothetical protein CMJ65_14305 [Planctomycetaceae bacterium]|jgi:SSS family solute:Na+ symporter|nr:hypothetical protein [Planctomycetaceae bacterium]